MRQSLIYIILLFSLLNCNRSINKKSNIILKTYYSPEKIKDITSLNSDSLKNGECFYFNEDGSLDSNVTYSNGRLNGLRSLYYPHVGIFTYEYHNDWLSKFRRYDTMNLLIYETPINLKQISKPTYEFKSKRNYFDQDKIDTIRIITKGLPPVNRGISTECVCFLPYRDGNKDESFIAKGFHHNKDLKEVKVYQNFGDTSEVPTLFDSLTIPAK